jgi:putative SOS response-associated peptidase YedK
MCGRFYLDVMQDELEAYFDVESPQALTARYNIAPSQDILAIVTQEQTRQLRKFHWGLIPFWAKDEKIGYKCINARAETVDTKPAFRAAFKYRRCLIPCSGFYEWKTEHKNKQPYCFRPTKQPMFALAGLYEHWHDGSGRQVDSCTIIVGDANSDVAPIHDRMPIILQPENFDSWLDPDTQTADLIKPLLSNLPQGQMDCFAVSRTLNNPRNDNPELIKAITTAAP